MRYTKHILGLAALLLAVGCASTSNLPNGAKKVGGVSGISRRQTEIGVRLALGGSSSNIVRLVLSRTAALVSAGLLLGIMAEAWWLSQFVSALLYGLAPRSVANLLTSAAILLIVAGASVALPARRATQVDPAELLRRPETAGVTLHTREWTSAMKLGPLKIDRPRNYRASQR